MTPRLHAIGPLLAVVALVSGMPGCGRFARQKPEPTGKVVVEHEGGKDSLTPAQQEESFQRACAEGLRLVNNGEFGLAIGAFETACELHPDSTEALFNLGACHESIGDPLKAINCYRRVLELSPDDADCYRNLGTSFIKLYYREKSPAWRKMAIDAWNRSLRLRPNQPDVRQYLTRPDLPA